MARQRKEKKAKDIKLRQPDRSGPAEKTLLQLAEERELFKQADARQRKNRRQKVGGEEEEEEDYDQHIHDDQNGHDEDGLSPTVERIMETLLYSVTLAMLHFTLDFLVQHQYGETIDWYNIVERASQAFMGALPPLLYPLLPVASSR